MLRVTTNSPLPRDPLPAQLRELVRLYLARQRRRLADLGLPAHGNLLLHLRRLGPVTQGEFGRAAGLDKSWISRIVERWVAEGLVERVPLPQDRRCLQLRLTPAGARLAARIDAQYDAHAAQLLADIPAAARAALAKALQMLSAALEEAESEETAP